MSSNFYGRNKEITRLRSLLKKNTASLVVIKGRRRIGKSRLADEFGKDRKTLNFDGLPPGDGVTAQDEREYFTKQLEINIGLRGIRADDWADLLYNLANHTKDEQTLIILDEINWMGSKDLTFLGKLKSAWDFLF